MSKSLISVQLLSWSFHELSWVEVMKQNLRHFFSFLLFMRTIQLFHNLTFYLSVFLFCYLWKHYCCCSLPHRRFTRALCLWVQLTYEFCYLLMSDLLVHIITNLCKLLPAGLKLYNSCTSCEGNKSWAEHVTMGLCWGPSKRADYYRQVYSS